MIISSFFFIPQIYAKVLTESTTSIQSIEEYGLKRAEILQSFIDLVIVAISLIVTGRGSHVLMVEKHGARLQYQTVPVRFSEWPPKGGIFLQCDL